jgi:glycosyltransferase involved in cell wall biosynthesis
VKVLFVSYPLLTVSEQSAGGAEQVLWTLERELVHSRGIEAWTAASNGSQVAGALIETGEPATLPDQLAEREREHFATILQAIEEHARRGAPFHLIQDMSGSFWRVADRVELPVLATLHLPRHFYPADAFQHVPENVRFNCVSASQAKTFADVPQVIGFIPNGIAVERFAAEPVVPIQKREYLLWLGRVCEEKGPHHALDLAHAAGERIIVAGAVYPFLYHQKFHAREVLPRLRRERSRARFLSSPSFEEKLGLLRQAKALLLTSTVDETSSLVAMEAAACGTPVLALRCGGFPEVVREGVTGLLANDFDEMRVLLERVSEINPESCRSYAVEHYGAGAMAERYLQIYPPPPVSPKISKDLQNHQTLTRSP